MWLLVVPIAQATPLSARLSTLEAQADGARSASAWLAIAEELTEEMKTTDGLHDDPALAFRTYAAIGRAAELGDSHDPELRTPGVNHALRTAAWMAGRDPTLLELAPPRWRDRIVASGQIGGTEVWILVVDEAPDLDGTSALRVVGREGRLLAMASFGRPRDPVQVASGLQVAVDVGVMPWGAGMFVAGPDSPVSIEAATAFVDGLWATGEVQRALQ